MSSILLKYKKFKYLYIADVEFYYYVQIEPQLMAGKHVMVVAHANSLRSIIMYLDNLTPQEVPNLSLVHMFFTIVF